jgi:hypothetical protein
MHVYCVLPRQKPEQAMNARCLKAAAAAAAAMLLLCWECYHTHHTHQQYDLQSTHMQQEQLSIDDDIAVL